MVDKRKKLFLFDIDGTLYDNDQRKVHDSTKEALIELRKTAHIGIATGRAEFMLYSIEDIIDLFDDFVLINGQYIKSNGEVVYSNSIDRNQISRLCKLMEELNITYGFQGSNDEAISNIDSRVLKSFDKLGLELPKINKDYYLNNDVYQVWAFCGNDEARILQNECPYFQFIKWLDVGFDILPVNASKGKGVIKLANHLEIDMKDVVVFGDGDNDYEMIKNAGLGIAMGNATKKVKEVADYVTSDIGDDGIYKALKRFNFI